MRNDTYPIIIDNLLQIEICNLKEWEYLLPNQIKTGGINWNSKDSVHLKVDTSCKNPYLRISYLANKKKIIQNIDLIPKTSNLGIGTVWLFKCSHTQKLCRKLYFSTELLLFVQRTAIKNLYYDKQLYSKNHRMVMTLRKSIYGTEKIYEEIYSKYFTKYYKGKPTKKYQSLLNTLDRYDKNSFLIYELLK